MNSPILPFRLQNHLLNNNNLILSLLSLAIFDVSLKSDHSTYYHLFVTNPYHLQLQYSILPSELPILFPMSPSPFPLTGSAAPKHPLHITVNINRKLMSQVPFLSTRYPLCTSHTWPWQYLLRVNLTICNYTLNTTNPNTSRQLPFQLSNFCITKHCLSIKKNKTLSLYRGSKISAKEHLSKLFSSTVFK